MCGLPEENLISTSRETGTNKTSLNNSTQNILIFTVIRRRRRRRRCNGIVSVHSIHAVRIANSIRFSTRIGWKGNGNGVPSVLLGSSRTWLKITRSCHLVDLRFFADVFFFSHIACLYLYANGFCLSVPIELILSRCVYVSHSFRCVFGDICIFHFHPCLASFTLSLSLSSHIPAVWTLTISWGNVFTRKHMCMRGRKIIHVIETVYRIRTNHTKKRLNSQYPMYVPPIT